MKLSVIIPAYNQLERVLTCVNSLRAYATTDPEIIVWDDASPEYFGPAVIPPCVAQCGRNAVNLGFAGNCNAGASQASGEVLMFINQDVFAVEDWSTGWDAAILQAFMDHPRAGIVGARLLFRNGAIQNAGGEFDAKRQPYHRCLGYTHPRHDEVNVAREVAWTTGAALAVRRDVLAEAGGFDTAYRMYFEDVDLCLRVAERGYMIRYEPACTLIHDVGSGGGSAHFRQSMLTFKQRWVDTGKIEPGTGAVKERFW